MNHSSLARTNMIKQQLRTGNVLNESILDLYRDIPRDLFVPSQFKDFAYSDMQIPLAHEQRMFTPLEEGLILESLQLKGHEVVLEIGTGSGFLTALLSRLCKKVISVDYFSEFTQSAQKNLDAVGCTNVELVTGDGMQGWVDCAPYEVVLFSGAIDKLTDTQRLQLLPGGQFFVILGKAPVMRAEVHQLDHQKHWQKKLVFETNIPPLINQQHQKRFVF